MRKNLIRVLFLILIFSLESLASTYEWSVAVDKKSVAVNEALYLKYRCDFSDRGELYVIDFNPVTQNENYTIVLLSEQTQIRDGKRSNIYEFVAYIHKSGETNFTFDTVMKKTNQDSIENTVIGRDNGEYEEYTKHFIKQETLLIDVKQSDTQLTGVLKFMAKHTNSSVKAYTPYNVELVIEGIGNFDALKPREFVIDGVKVFTSEPVLNVKLTKEGYKGSWHQKFAFVADESYTIPSFAIDYFDLESHTKKSLLFEPLQVDVLAPYKKEELLDEEEESFSFDFSFVYYLLTFIAGFLAAKIRFKKEIKRTPKELVFYKKIEDAKSLDDIVFILVLENRRQDQLLIRQIEDGEITSLREVKKLISD